MKFYKFVIIIAFIIFIFFAGAMSNQSYNNNNRKTEGLFIKGFNESGVKDIAYDKEPFGEWVCVNIKDMEYERAVEVISHEVGHEMFAEKCEKDIDKCFEVMKQIENDI